MDSNSLLRRLGGGDSMMCGGNPMSNMLTNLLGGSNSMCTGGGMMNSPFNSYRSGMGMQSFPFQPNYLQQSLMGGGLGCNPSQFNIMPGNGIEGEGFCSPQIMNGLMGGSPPPYTGGYTNYTAPAQPQYVTSSRYPPPNPYPPYAPAPYSS